MRTILVHSRIRSLTRKRKVNIKKYIPICVVTTNGGETTEESESPIRAVIDQRLTGGA